MGTLLEDLVGTQILKCGVPHTGQRHQVAKAKEVIRRVDKYPERVIVGHFVGNDALDDLLFPRATAIEGYLVDQAYIEGNDLKRLARTALHERYIAWETGDREAKNVASTNRHWLVALLKDHSLTANIVRRGLDWLAPSLAITSREVDAAWSLRARDASREAILDMKAWCDGMGADLLLVLVPAKDDFETGDPFVDTKAFLAQHEIAYVDLFREFSRAYDQGHRNLYWERDAHFAPDGERLVAEIVARELTRVSMANR